jgi:hypothetical protein
VCHETIEYEQKDQQEHKEQQESQKEATQQHLVTASQLLLWLGRAFFQQCLGV